jgi:ABC-type dipeptide/oligopeptide/nickel transport system permease component
MTKRKHNNQVEPDSVFLLKITMYFLLGSMWVRLTGLDFSGGSISLPFGLVLGLYFAHHEHFKIDRKIEYAILLAASIGSFYLPTGFVLIL